MLTSEEHAQVVKVLNREPNKAEIAIFDAMWSEHCSYKSSKRWFRVFNTSAPHLELGLGEGAGIVNLGDNLLVGLALESHNHPSAISPYDGAATGVGGIIRDVLSQGCKPIALLDAIRFGNLESKHSQYLFENVVRGISFYGNCCGIPTVGGEVEFAPAFENNCLVNVMCIGVIDREKIVRSKAETPGNFILLYGAKTGRDGIHGVSFASKDLSEKSEKERPAVQIGDPLMEKVLIDVTLELIEENLLDGLQDLGGGGLSCAVSEMAFNGKTGAIIRLEDVPLRETDMQPWEILVSESQERMLGIVSPHNINQVVEILEKNDLPYGIIGEVTDNSHYIAYYKGNKISALPVDLIVDGFPEPKRIMTKPKYIGKRKDLDLPLTQDIKKEILRLFGSPNIADKSWVYQQYDQHVQTHTNIQAGSDAAVLRLDNGKYIALTLDCNSFMVYLDPYNGTANGAAEAMRNLTAVGARPLALVDCLNFGNPEKSDSYWQFVESVKGLGQFSRDFEIPIVGGNVSFYNETMKEGKRERINPTPVIGLMGIIDNEDEIIENDFQQSNSKILIVGETDTGLDGTEYLRYNHDLLQGPVPVYNKEKELLSKNSIMELKTMGYIRSCHDISQGGLIIALGEMMIKNSIGAKISLKNLPVKTELSLEEKIFSESTARYIVEVSEEHIITVKEILETNKTPYALLGETKEKPILEIEEIGDITLKSIKEKWKLAITNYMEV